MRTVEGENATSSTVLALLSGACVIGAIAYLFYAIKRSASLFRAAVSGEVREARVEGIRDTGVTVNKVRQFALQWVDAVGQTGESLGHPGDRLDTWPVGSIILVYADPKTGATWWEEDIAPAR